MDRWVEMDIDWFERPGWGAQTSVLLDRLAPLWRDISGEYGIVFNFGFLADIVLVWSGDPEQTLPLKARRLASWAEASYSELASLMANLREEADARDLPELRLGLFVAGPGEVVWPPETGSLYDLYGTWYQRHPEAYPLDVSLLPGPDLDPRVPLEGDDHVYAAFPDGIPEGACFASLLGSQWAALADFLGLDALHLRDGFLGPMLYSRRGPHGTAASPNPDENQTWTDAVIDICREVKSAAPDSTLMLYSSGIGGTAEWRVGCVDLEQVVAAGDVDVFVDQTWGGAWQDWWEQNWKSWTFQVANLAMHGAMIRGANLRRERPCRHYKLIETWDGWEPWDTIHLTPDKLEWAIWALSHAAVLTPEGPRVADGSYVSWMNSRDRRLLSAEDVAWLRARLAAAESSAADLEEVRGPVLVHDRTALERLHREQPSTNHSEWVEDQAGFLMKWGTPVLAATRSEWLADIYADTYEDGLILQVPGADTASRLPEGTGLLIAGRAGAIHPELLAACGASSTGGSAAAGYVVAEFTSPDLKPREPVFLPDRDLISAGVTLIDSDTGPLLTRGERGLHWQPPDLSDPGNAWLPHHQIGSCSPYVETVRAFSQVIAETGGVWVDPLPPHLPATVHLWRSGGQLHILAGNLETGWIGDSRHPRRVKVRIPTRLLAGPLCDHVDDTAIAPLDSDATHTEFDFEIPPEGFRHFVSGEAR